MISYTLVPVPNKYHLFLMQNTWRPKPDPLVFVYDFRLFFPS